MSKMRHFIIIVFCVLFALGKYATAERATVNELDSILNRKFQILKDLSACSGELESLVNESRVLSIPVKDIIDKLQTLESDTENEIQIYDYMKGNISEIGKADKTDGENFDEGRSNVTEIQLPQTQLSGTCLHNTWARNYYDGNETSHGGLTWKRGRWQSIGRSKDGQLGLRLKSFSLSDDYSIAYISGLAVLDDGTIAATDNHNFVLSLYNLDGVRQKTIFFEPLLVEGVSAIPGETRKVIVNVKLLDNTNAKLLVDIDDGSKRFLNDTTYNEIMQTANSNRRGTQFNCTVDDSRVRYHRYFYQNQKGESFYGTYGRKQVIYFDSNCNYKGVFSQVKYRQQVVSVTGIADLVLMQFDRGGRQIDNDRVNIYKIP